MNRRPTGYESVALSTELYKQIYTYYKFKQTKKQCIFEKFALLLAFPELFEITFERQSVMSLRNLQNVGRVFEESKGFGLTNLFTKITEFPKSCVFGSDVIENRHVFLGISFELFRAVCRIRVDHFMAFVIENFFHIENTSCCRINIL